MLLVVFAVVTVLVTPDPTDDANASLRVRESVLDAFALLLLAAIFDSSAIFPLNANWLSSITFRDLIPILCRLRC